MAADEPGRIAQAITGKLVATAHQAMAMRTAGSRPSAIIAWDRDRLDRVLSWEGWDEPFWLGHDPPKKTRSEGRSGEENSSAMNAPLAELYLTPALGA
jgi:hypothetical protein